MGFDNECILNIQSLAGEYFCPVCRLLVYPNEALQSQCTHLYCKPCLTYVVGTTQACPYDGYLVTEADSKSLVESNKALAETIGKITVHCLYHRSGCTWQGPLSECTSHCSGCAFGISPVVCNRCGIQIVHRQVQEHAQNCPGVQSQVQQAEVAQNAAATGNAATGDPIQTATQAGATTSQAQTSHSTTAPKPGQDPNQQANSNSQAQAVVQAAVPTPEQWYQQQQQQYQQYYQQYPGYDPYQQQYQQYYQQQAATQYQQQPQVYMQPQSQSQTQVQPQPHGLPQSHAPAQPQNQAPVNPQQTHPTVQPHPQTQAQIQPPPHGHPHPQPHPVQSHLQHVHMPQYQQPHSQMQHPQHPIQPQAHSQLHAQHHPVPQPHSLAQPQTHPQLHPPQSNQPLNPNVLLQTQHSSAQAVTGHHSYPSQQPHQQMQVGAPQQYLMHMHSGPHSQLQHPVQMQNQFPQQPPQMRPHATVPNQQQPALLTSPGQVPNVPPAQIHPHAHQSGLSVHQRPLIQPVQQPTPQQYVQQQQPFAGQPPASVQNQMHQQGPFVQQQLPVQSQLRPQGPSYPFQQHSHSYPQQQQQGMQPHQSQNLLGRPTMANHGVLSQPYPQSGAGMQVRSVQPNANQLSANQNNVLRANNQVQLSSEQQSGANIPEKSVTEREAESFQKTDKKDANDLNATSGLGANAAETKTPKIEADMKSVDDEDRAVGKVEDKSSAVDASAKEHAVENSEPVIEHKVKEEATESNKDHKDVLDVDHKQVEHSVSEDKKIQDVSLLKTTPLQEETSGKMKDTNLPPVQGTLQGPGINESRGTPSIDYGPSSFQQRPGAPPPAPPQHTQLPGHPPTQFRPPGPGHVPHPGHPVFKQPHGPEIPLGGMPGPGTTTSFGRGPNHFGPPQHGLEPQSVAPQGPYNQGYAPYGPESQMGQQRPANRMEAEIFPHHPHLPGSLERGPFGQPSGMHSNMMRMNGAPGPDSSGLRDERFRPLPDECANPFLVDPARQVFDRVGSEEDLKQFPRPSHLDAEPVPKFGGYFSLSRPHRGHGFGMDIGSKLDPVAGPAASRSVGLHEEPVGRSDSARTHPDFLGPVPGYGRRHMDGLAARSPVREFPGLYSHGFGGRPGGIGSSRSGLDDIDGRDSHRFGDFHESRLPILSSHLRRGEFEGPGTMRIGEHLRSGDLIGHDILPSHLGRGEHFGPRNLRLGQPVGFGAFPGQARMGDFPPPRLGEPGFRSSFSIPGFPNDGVYRGDMESFDNSRKRKPTSMGWCRICKVDCETVEGLDLHSQTRDHQKMAMDMVVNIKQNAKKQKLNSNERSSLDDSSKSRNASFEGRGNKR